MFATLLRASSAEAIRNAQVAVAEQALAPGAMWRSDAHPAVIVYLDPGAIEMLLPEKDRTATHVTRGYTVFCPAGAILKNRGTGDVHFVRIEFLGAGTSEQWGTSGLAPHYTLLFENQFGRVYDIRIPAGTSEPRHSHHDRVVVCLSGAELRHEMPDGRSEKSTLKTGEIAWRRGGTHVGHNLGQTDLWVIAIEPK